MLVKVDYARDEKRFFRCISLSKHVNCERCGVTILGRALLLNKNSIAYYVPKLLKHSCQFSKTTYLGYFEKMRITSFKKSLIMIVLFQKDQINK